MRKKVSVFLAVLMVFSMLFLASAADDFFIVVMVDDVEVEFDSKPEEESGRALVPFRAIAEALGAEVDWDEETATVLMEMGDIEISLEIGSDQLFVNGEATTIDVPARLNEGGRTLVPLRAISVAFGCDVQWDPDTSTAWIYSADYEPSEDAVKIELKTENTSVKADDETVVLEVAVTYPVFTGGGEIYAVVNPYVLELLDSFVDEAIEYFSDFAFDAYAEDDEDFEILYLYIDLDITFVSDEYISGYFLVDFDGEAILQGFVYSIDADSLAMFNEFVDIDDVADAIVEAIIELATEKADLFYEDFLDDLDGALFDGFYLDADGDVVVYFNPGYISDSIIDVVIW